MVRGVYLSQKEAESTNLEESLDRYEGKSLPPKKDTFRKKTNPDLEVPSPGKTLSRLDSGKGYRRLAGRTNKVRILRQYGPA